MMKFKKMQKLTSEKDLLSEKPFSVYGNDNKTNNFDGVSVKIKKSNNNDNNFRDD
jgi:hypothetical protein